jgi:hypothetical protein
MLGFFAYPCKKVQSRITPPKQRRFLLERRVAEIGSATLDPSTVTASRLSPPEDGDESRALAPAGARA